MTFVNLYQCHSLMTFVLNCYIWDQVIPALLKVLIGFPLRILMPEFNFLKGILLKQCLEVICEVISEHRLSQLLFRVPLLVSVLVYLIYGRKN